MSHRALIYLVVGGITVAVLVGGIGYVVLERKAEIPVVIPDTVESSEPTPIPNVTIDPAPPPQALLDVDVTLASTTLTILDGNRIVKVIMLKDLPPTRTNVCKDLCPYLDDPEKDYTFEKFGGAPGTLYDSQNQKLYFLVRSHNSGGRIDIYLRLIVYAYDMISDSVELIIDPSSLGKGGSPEPTLSANGEYIVFPYVQIGRWGGNCVGYVIRDGEGINNGVLFGNVPACEDIHRELKKNFTEHFDFQSGFRPFDGIEAFSTQEDVNINIVRGCFVATHCSEDHADPPKVMLSIHVEDGVDDGYTKRSFLVYEDSQGELRFVGDPDPPTEFEKELLLFFFDGGWKK